MLEVKTQKHSPKQLLWDDCLEFQAFIESHTAKDHDYDLKGKCPETALSGETADISAFAKYGSYDWVKYRDTTVSYPDDKLILGRYLGQSTDIGPPAMTAKILKDNGLYQHRTTLRELTKNEIRDLNEIKARQEFDAEIRKRLGPSAKAEDFDVELDIETANFDLYEDAQDGNAILDDSYGNYIRAELTFQKGDEMMVARVKRRRLDSFGNAVGTNANPIMNTRLHTVKFADGAVAKYSANIIDGNMRVQCDINSDEYQLLDAIIDHTLDGHRVKHADGCVRVDSRKHIIREGDIPSLAVNSFHGHIL
jgi:hypothetical protein